MKKLILTPILALLMMAGSMVTAQNNPQAEYLGLPGDNLNLFAVMNLFRDSETLEVFERSLNDPNRMINNLDLNGDNVVDYIMVFDYAEGNVHNIVLRVALNRNEFQDVAVFFIERLSNGEVLIQLVGDEALYGPNYIIEPHYAETPNPGYRGAAKTKGNQVTVVHTTQRDVARWPVIVYMHRPVYRPWRSTWYWGYQPVWWSPWTPHYWHYYHGYHYHWHVHYVTYYRPAPRVRHVHYHTVYHTRIRTHSPTVVVNVERGRYRNTYNHPEQRAQGENLFVQRHPDRPVRTGTATDSGRAVGRHADNPGEVSRGSGRGSGVSNATETNAPRSGSADGQLRESGRGREAGSAEGVRGGRERGEGSSEIRETREAGRNTEQTGGSGREGRGSSVRSETEPTTRTDPAQENNRSRSSDRVAPAPARQTETAPSRPQQRSGERQVAPAPVQPRQNTTPPSRTQQRPAERQATPAPARTEQRPVERQAPAAPARTEQRPAQRQATPAPARTEQRPVERQAPAAPARTEQRPVERQAPAAPARTEQRSTQRQASPAPAPAPARATQPSAPARESAPAQAAPARSSGRSETQPARSNERSTPAPQSNSGNSNQRESRSSENNQRNR